MHHRYAAHRWVRRARRWPVCALFVSAVLLGTIMPGGTSVAQQEATAGTGLSGKSIGAFQLSILHDMKLGIVSLIRNGEFKQATQVVRQIIDKYPQLPGNHYLLAVLLARQNKIDAAYDRLVIAIRRGFSETKLIQTDPAFERLRKQNRVQSLIEMIGAMPVATIGQASEKISPANIRNGFALIDESNSQWDPKLNVIKSAIRFDANKIAANKVQAGNDKLQKLNAWFVQGAAAGNVGDLYDNRDRNHSGSRLTRSFPQLSSTKYGAGAKNTGIDYGLNNRIFFNAITIGNSSTAFRGRSQARHALTLPGTPRILFLQYINNHLYIYPEVKDYDPERGDLFPANTPYMIVSQGSSKSDIPFLHATASILAAFRPNVKNYLRQNRLVMPTLQMVFRRGQKTVNNDQDYLSAKAHPPVFKAENIDLVKMIDLANQLRIEDIPPMVRLKVIEESGLQPGIDDFASAMSEKLFTTPSAIGRVVRSTAYEKRMVVQIRNTGEKGRLGRSYHWVVLSGDADRIKINKRNQEGSEVEILVPWHKRRPVPERPGMTTDRVEIGVFVKQGKYYSAPAFINFQYPPNQRRIYDEQHRIKSIDHRDPEYRKRFLDARQFVKRDWIDVYNYDQDSKLIGWQRTRGKWKSYFTRDGAKVIEWDEQGRAIKARNVRYTMELNKKTKFVAMVESPGKGYLRYRYGNDRDLIGSLYRQ